MFIFTIFIFILITIGTVSAADITVGPGKTYSNINDAIYNANDGDNIQVYDQAGSPYTYTENVVVNKPNLNIQANGFVTVTASDNAKSVFEITSSGAGSSITGFTVTGITSNEYDSYGRPNSHVLIDSDNCKANGNTIIGTLIPSDSNPDMMLTTGGIVVWGTGNSITGNTLKDSSILISGATYNNVVGNTLTSAAANSGITVGPLDTNHNTVQDNTISGYSTGIRVTDSTDNQLIGNKISGGFNGISLMSVSFASIVSNIIYDNSGYGILSNGIFHYNIRGNTISNCNIGALFEGSTVVFFTGNTLLDNSQYGIWLKGSSSNTIANNKISGSQTGILVDEVGDGFEHFFPSSDNEIWSCNIFNNGNGILFGAVFSSPSGNKVSWNRIAYNTAWALINYSGEVVDATYNWWGSNSNPSGKIHGPAIYAPWLILKASAPSGIYSGGLALITASLNYASDGSIIQETAPSGITALFSTDNGVIGSPKTTVNGVATSVLLFTYPWDTNVQVKIDDEIVNLKLANIPLLLDLVKIKNFKKWKLHYLYFVKIIAPDGQITTKIFRGDLRGYKSRILNLGKLPKGSIVQITSYITNKSYYKRTISLVNSLIKSKFRWNFQWIYRKNVLASPGRFWRSFVLSTATINI